MEGAAVAWAPSTFLPAFNTLEGLVLAANCPDSLK
jgi:hypothetical protein